MTISVSLVLLYGLILFFLLRGKSLGYGSAFIAVMFGFFLASTSAAGPVNELTTAVINAIPDL
ncbi:hypothetical protein [Streptomyces sp. NPDC058308]|uniref:hypothetical protein n=1 Tax=Streptomyces sp. NPDC058308 TaxID=3346440 RepID=UPI0036EBA78B